MASMNLTASYTEDEDGIATVVYEGKKFESFYPVISCTWHECHELDEGTNYLLYIHDDSGGWPLRIKNKETVDKIWADYQRYVKIRDDEYKKVNNVLTDSTVKEVITTLQKAVEENSSIASYEMFYDYVCDPLRDALRNVVYSTKKESIYIIPTKVAPGQDLVTYFTVKQFIEKLQSIVEGNPSAESYKVYFRTSDGDELIHKMPISHSDKTLWLAPNKASYTDYW